MVSPSPNWCYKLSAQCTLLRGVNSQAEESAAGDLMLESLLSVAWHLRLDRERAVVSYNVISLVTEQAHGCSLG